MNILNGLFFACIYVIIYGIVGFTFILDPLKHLKFVMLGFCLVFIIVIGIKQ